MRSLDFGKPLSEQHIRDLVKNSDGNNNGGLGFETLFSLRAWVGECNKTIQCISGETVTTTWGGVYLNAVGDLINQTITTINNWQGGDVIVVSSAYGTMGADGVPLYNDEFGEFLNMLLASIFFGYRLANVGWGVNGNPYNVVVKNMYTFICDGKVVQNADVYYYGIIPDEIDGRTNSDICLWGMKLSGIPAGTKKIQIEFKI